MSLENVSRRMTWRENSRHEKEDFGKAEINANRVQNTQVSWFSESLRMQQAYAVPRQ